MLQILLTILKILGILLLVLVGLLLFIIVTVLFVPIRYSVIGEKHKGPAKEGEDTEQEVPQVIKVKVVVSWLVHLVHFRFRLQNNDEDTTSKDSKKDSKKKSEKKSEKKSKIKTDMELYLFGIPFFALKNKISEKRKKSKVKSVTESSTQPNVDSSLECATGLQADETCETVLHDTSKSEPTKESDMNAVTEVLEEELETNDELFMLDAGETELNSESDAETKKEKVNPIKKIFQSIKAIPEKIKATIESIKLTIQKICGKIRAGSDFLKDETTKITIRLLLGKLKNIIVHILPKKIKGNLIFGLDDPALTGEILGVLSLFYPKYQKTLKIIPVFEQQILEGKVLIKGRIIIAYIVWQAVKLVLDKTARLTFKNAKNLVAEIKK